MNIKKIISELTLEEKAGLCSGADWWHTKEVKRLGVPSVMVSDGPHGLRKQVEKQENVGEEQVIQAVCFPTASSLACSFDTELLYELGQAIGDECQAEEVSTILGPGINMKRSPLCGRNFEYYSEDPYQAGQMGAAFVAGVQSKQIGTSLKHFAANNQEYRRLGISAKVDERTLREIYLPAFETVVKKAQPWTIMCSYNCINGTYSSENDWLLNKVLREEWGFEGLVMSDWGAVSDRVKGVAAGLDLEMPASRGITDAQLVEAVKAGELSEEVLDQACERILILVERYENHRVKDAVFEKEAHHELARKVESECAVLLKNEGILPLKKEQKVVFIGGYAKQPRYQGGGSSHINSFKVSSACDCCENEFVLGFDVEQIKVDENRMKEAVEAAKNAEVAVIFAGLPDSYESEGFDRKHMNMPPCQNALIEEVAKVQPNTVVVLHNGSPILMPWANQVKGILEMYLGGQAVGAASVDLLYGVVNPSGKLAETFPMRLQDNPSYLNFPGTKETVSYSEGLYIGYRYYDKKEMEVLYPFGYGLSYTSFDYSNLMIKKTSETVSVSVTVKNTGECFGKETVQLYVHQMNSRVERPEKELKGFVKVALMPGEEKTVVIELDRRAFAYYDVTCADWVVDTDTFELLVGKSSREIVLTDKIKIEGDKPSTLQVTARTLIGDIIDFVGDLDAFVEELKAYAGENQSFLEEKEKFQAIVFDMPVHAMRSFLPFSLTDHQMQEIVDRLTK